MSTTNEAGIMLLILAAAIYFVPTFIAYGRGIKHRFLLLLGNLLFGLSVIGWFAALVYAWIGELDDGKREPASWTITPPRFNRSEPTF